MKKIVCLALVLFSLFSGFSEESPLKGLFNANLSLEEREKLLNGEILIRHTNDFSKVCLKKSEYQELERVRQIMEFLNPNYFAEVLYMIPYKGNENLCDIVEGYFKDVPSYKMIPFYTNYEKREWKPLFSVAEKLEEMEFDGRYIMTNRFRMKPLSKYLAKMDMERSEENMVFTHSNISKMTVWGITAVKDYKCLAGLAIVRIGDNYLVYGAGGANAWKPEKFKAKLEDMFSSRILDFMRYYIEKLEKETGRK